MASRPIFLPIRGPSVGIDESAIEFNWHPGMAPSQKQKNIRALHTAAAAAGVFPLLEISSKSEDQLGIALSAFNLTIVTRKNASVLTVETAFQGSKVFERGGPYKDLFGLDSRRAKSDIRLKESGNLIGFKFFGREFPSSPRTFFYDWIYINALNQHQELADAVTTYVGFSDIEFNPSKSINCQARSVALFASLRFNDLLFDALKSPAEFLEILKSHYASDSQQHTVQGSIV